MKQIDEGCFLIIESPKWRGLTSINKWLINGFENTFTSFSLATMILMCPLMLGRFIYKKLFPITKRYTSIGRFILSQKQLIVSYNSGEEITHEWNTIQRLDMYLGKGIGGWMGEDVEDYFKATLVLRLRIVANGKEKVLFVKNNTEGLRNTGELFDQFRVLRKLNVNNHRKIQFWDKI